MKCNDIFIFIDFFRRDYAVHNFTENAVHTHFSALFSNLDAFSAIPESPSRLANSSNTSCGFKSA